MCTAAPTPREFLLTPSGRPVRRGDAARRAWTGRARTQCATDSGLPELVPASTHRTRVSEMRLHVVVRCRTNVVRARTATIQSQGGPIVRPIVPIHD